MTRSARLGLRDAVCMCSRLNAYTICLAFYFIYIKRLNISIQPASRSDRVTFRPGRDQTGSHLDRLFTKLDHILSHTIKNKKMEWQN